VRTLAATLLLATTTALSAQVPAQPPAPDTLYIHGDILTGAHLKPSDPSLTPARVTAIAIAHGTILAVGTDAEILGMKSPQTKVIDLQGAFAMPGFNDAHTHIASAGQQKLSIDLDGTTSLADMQQRIQKFAATAPPNSWLQGGGWDHTKWATKTLPTKADLDSVTGQHPAMFYRTDGHIVVANSAALALANITSATPNPPGGKIDHDATGAPTGIIREGPAVALLAAKIPPPTPDERRRALSLAITDALDHGVTSVQDYSDWDDFLVLEQMEREHTLLLRISEWLTFADPVHVLKEHQAAHSLNDPLLHTGMLKGFMDGSLGSRTAALNAPYADDPGNSGIPRYDAKSLQKLADERALAGFQIGFHAIGDRANGMALDAIQHADESRMKMMQKLLPKLETQTGAHISVSLDARNRIEHAQVVSPGDFDRFARLHVIASMQPSHLLTDMAWAEQRLGPERVKYSYAWRSFLDHNVPLAFGTDYPVESINPFRGIYAATTRMNEAGTATYQPQEKITLAEALYAYTQGSAYADKAEKLKGRLEPGYLADIVVLDSDPAKSTPQQLLHTRVLRTIVNGETVYEAPVSGTP
jgi:predicted amidohydrolase YtcJ